MTCDLYSIDGVSFTSSETAHRGYERTAPAGAWMSGGGPVPGVDYSPSFVIYPRNFTKKQKAPYVVYMPTDFGMVSLIRKEVAPNCIPPPDSPGGRSALAWTVRPGVTGNTATFE